MTEQDWYAQVGATLRSERQKRGWTIYDVAALLGVSAVAVSHWERAQRRMRAHYYVQLRTEGLL